MSRILKLLGVMLVWSVVCGAIRRDEFLCEEAHARLVECCPGFTTGPSYCTYSSGCGESSYPELSSEESDCIRVASCAELRDRGICARAAARGAPRTYNDSGTAHDAGDPSEPVCR